MSNEPVRYKSTEPVLSDFGEMDPADRESARWLADHKGSLELRPGYLPASQKRLISLVQTSAVTQPVLRHPSAWQKLAGTPVRKLVWVVMLLVVLFANTNSISAAARTSFPGDIFYPVKIAHEETRVALSFSQAGDARLHTSYAQRRLAESAGLVLEGRYEALVPTAINFAWHVQQAVANIQSLALADPAAAAQLAHRLNEVVFRQTDVLALLEGAVPINQQIGIQAVLSVAAQGQVDLAAFLDQ